MDKYNVYILLLAILILGIGYYLGYNAGRSYVKCNPLTLIHKDTVKVIKEVPKIVMQKKAKIKYLRDTVLTTRPFEAVVDTVLLKDTVYIAYSYPENTFNVSIARGADTNLIERNYYLVNEQQNKQSSWTSAALNILGGFLGGLVVGFMAGR